MQHSLLKIGLVAVMSPFMSLGLQAQGAEGEKIDKPAIPKRFLDNPKNRAELGINEFTAPSIRLIFDDLDQLTPLPYKETNFQREARTV